MRTTIAEIQPHARFPRHASRLSHGARKTHRERPCCPPPIAALAAILVSGISLLLGGCGTTVPVSAATNATGSLVISTSAVEFGAVPIGQTAAATVTLSNSGSGSLQINNIQVAGKDFSLAGNVSAPINLANGAQYNMTVQFGPTVAAAETGTITLTTNSSSSPVTISLSGTGETPAGVLSGLSCASGSMTGAGSDACTVTLNNPAGSGGLAVSLASSNSAVTVPASVTVAAGATTATFTATVSAVTTAENVTLTATAAGVTETYTLDLGAATPALTLSATTVAFGDVNLNTPATKTVILTSSGTAPLTLSAGAVTGTGFSISGVSFPLTLNPNATATLDIQFDPTASGAVTGSVTLTDNTSAGTAAISLSGTGQATAYEVQLTWDAPSSSTDPVAGYNVYRATGTSTSYQLVGSTVVGTTQYTDTTVADGASYTYYVESVDAEGNTSSPSTTYTANIP